MKILVVGSGGREHALAWKLAQSPHCTELWAAPGNPGMTTLGKMMNLAVVDVRGLVDFAHQKKFDLVVIGPETALNAGLSDAMQSAGLVVFGPSRAAAQIETSKVFAKQFMIRHNIPTARFATFDNLKAALEQVEKVDYPIVIKASGLAAGKGVILPETLEESRAALHEIMLEGRFGTAGSEVVIEERLEGEELSVMAFVDGNTFACMPAAQDHKRLLDRDRGPNTGGMGTYAPAPLCDSAMYAEIQEKILRPVVDGLRAEGIPFVGVLYAGIIVTAEGLRVLEFNARFGDPETQVVLPLLENDLVELLSDCINHKLQPEKVHWKDAAAVCVVMASAGYPESHDSGRLIEGLNIPLQDGTFFHAGTRRVGEAVLTSGGRVLGVTCWGRDLQEAVNAAYKAVKKVRFEGAQYRRDIAAKAFKKVERSAYAASGVSIDAGTQAVQKMSEAVRSTYTPAVLAGIGAFGGLYDAAVLQKMNHPVLVASTDGVGTKVKLAAQTGRYETVGQDIVNHCINDILVQGARPLFFLDYFATSRLEPDAVAAVVKGISMACKAAGCVLLGGETAEMPGVYQSGEFDLAGTIIGCLEKERILPRKDLKPGDVLVGVRSSGPHTNGYSLIRRVFADVDLDVPSPDLKGVSLAEALLVPHRSYLDLFIHILEQEGHPIKALAHLTGGGFIENIPRILPEGITAVVRKQSWPVLPIFKLIQARGGIDESEMYRVFNMGIGMVAVVAPEKVAALQAALPEETWIIGALKEGKREVVLA